MYVEGRLQTRKWQGQDGQDRYTTEIVINEMQMLDSRGGSGMGQGQGMNQGMNQGMHQGMNQGMNQNQGGNQPAPNQQSNPNRFGSSKAFKAAKAVSQTKAMRCVLTKISSLHNQNRFHPTTILMTIFRSRSRLQSLFIESPHSRAFLCLSFRLDPSKSP